MITESYFPYTSCVSDDFRPKSKRENGHFCGKIYGKNLDEKVQDKKNGGEKMARHGENIRKRIDGKSG